MNRERISSVKTEPVSRFAVIFDNAGVANVFLLRFPHLERREGSAYFAPPFSRKITADRPIGRRSRLRRGHASQNALSEKLVSN